MFFSKHFLSETIVIADHYRAIEILLLIFWSLTKDFQDQGESLLRELKQ